MKETDPNPRVHGAHILTGRPKIKQDEEVKYAMKC